MTAGIMGAASSGRGLPLFLAAVGNPGVRNATSSDGIAWTEIFPAGGGVVSTSSNVSRNTLAIDKWLTSIQNAYDIMERNGSSSFQSTLVTVGGATFSMCYGNGKYVAIFAAGGVTKISYATTLTGTWTPVIIAGGNSAGGTCIDYLNGLFVAISANGYVSTSSDAITWVQRHAGSRPYGITNNCMDFGNGHYVIGNDTGSSYLYSNDAITFTSKTISGFTSDIASIIYWNGTWYAFDQTHVATTTTPQTAASWSVTSTTFAGVTSVMNVASCPSRLVIFGNGASSAPKISYGTDGINWTAASISSVLGTSGGVAGVSYVRS